MKRLLPAPLRRWLRQRRRTVKAYRALVRVYLYDFRNYRKASPLGLSYDDPEQLRSRIIIDAHKLEKGLALPEPRLGFGRDTIARLLQSLKMFRKRFGADYSADWSLATLGAYQEYNRTHGEEVTWFDPQMADLQAASGTAIQPELGGYMEHTPDPDATWDAAAFGAFARARHSARIYSDAPVAPELIARAAASAQYTPSVCNRQSGRLHVYRDRATMDALLKAQGGSRGFGDTAPVLIAITADRRGFQTPQERNQCWIDGGLFAMSFIYALHAEGLGSCCLNWSRDVDMDRIAHQAGAIPDHEAIIMLLAVGHLPDSLRVARSARRPLDHILQEHG